MPLNIGTARFIWQEPLSSGTANVSWRGRGPRHPGLALPGFSGGERSCATQDWHCQGILAPSRPVPRPSRRILRTATPLAPTATRASLRRLQSGPIRDTNPAERNAPCSPSSASRSTPLWPSASPLPSSSPALSRQSKLPYSPLIISPFLIFPMRRPRVSGPSRVLRQNRASLEVRVDWRCPHGTAT